MTPEKYTEYLHRHIPLTAALGAIVTRLEPGLVEITAPLEPNRNHRGTAFGGSLSALAILGGWVVLQQALQEAHVDARLVIQKSECDYLEPVDGDFVCESRVPTAEWPRFVDMLQRRGRARITVSNRIRIGGREAVRASGTYVALLQVLE